jgi:hypothetical protein
VTRVVRTLARWGGERPTLQRSVGVTHSPADTREVQGWWGVARELRTRRVVLLRLRGSKRTLIALAREGFYSRAGGCGVLIRRGIRSCERHRGCEGGVKDRRTLDLPSCGREGRLVAGRVEVSRSTHIKHPFMGMGVTLTASFHHGKLSDP